MRFRFSIRELLFAFVIIALGLGWWVDHRRLEALAEPQIPLWQVMDDNYKEYARQYEELQMLKRQVELLKSERDEARNASPQEQSSKAGVSDSQIPDDGPVPPSPVTSMGG